LSGLASRADVKAEFPENVMQAIPALEKASGGRLGVAVLDTATGKLASHRGAERFPMCSTFKVLAVGAVLTRVDAGTEQLERMIRFEAKDMVTYSPITSKHAGGPGMTLGEICAAALDYSDNTAANLLLGAIGGPGGVTQFARLLGDGMTRLDRRETALNEALPGDPRDTTTPLEMVRDMRKLMFGHVLSAGSRDQLTNWMLGCKTGDARLRAGVPKDWRVADKTGTGDRGTANDVGVFWPTRHAPVIVTAYLTGSTGSPEQQSATIAAVGRAVASGLR
jgi:beta-lactamase class A